MNQEKPDQSLSPQTVDYVASIAKAALGAIPFAGSLLVEVAGVIIPKQRIDRIARFAQELELRLAGIEQEFIRSQLSNENCADLMEEAVRQAARSVSEERRQYIATLIANSLSSQDISYIESKHLLRILGEINDIEIVRLASHLFYPSERAEKYWEKHKAILEPIAAYDESSQQEFDKETLRKSYDEHLTQLGLLEIRYRVDFRTKLPEFDKRTGSQIIHSRELTPLGKLLLRQVGIAEDEE